MILILYFSITWLMSFGYHFEYLKNDPIALLVSTFLGPAFIPIVIGQNLNLK